MNLYSNKNSFKISELDLIDASFANFICNKYDKKMVEAVFKKHKQIFLKNCKIALGESQNVLIENNNIISRNLETMFDFLLIKNLHITNKIVILDYPSKLDNKKEYIRKVPNSYYLNIPFSIADMHRPINSLFIKTLIQVNQKYLSYNYHLGESIFNNHRCLCLYMVNSYQVGSYSIDTEYMNNFLLILQFLLEYVNSYGMSYNKTAILILGFENEKRNINNFIKNLSNRNLTSSITYIDRHSDIINDEANKISLIKDFLKN